jgi:hypothetical protein
MEHLKLFVARINIPKVSYTWPCYKGRHVKLYLGHQSYRASTSLARTGIFVHQV